MTDPTPQPDPDREVVLDVLARHRVNYHSRNIGGGKPSTRRYTSCDGCDWQGGWHDEAGWEVHLADVLFAARTADAAARLRDLTHRLGFGDGITEPMADNDTIVRRLYDEQRDADEWREHQRWLNDCAQAGCDPTQDCPRHAPACHPAHPDPDAATRLAAVDRDAVAREVYRSLHPGGINRRDSERTRESDAADRDLAYKTWEDGRMGRAHYDEAYKVADAVLALSATAPDAGQRRPNICPTCGTHHVSERVGGQEFKPGGGCLDAGRLCICGDNRSSTHPEPPNPTCPQHAGNASQRESKSAADALRQAADALGHVYQSDSADATACIVWLRTRADRMDRP